MFHFKSYRRSAFGHFPDMSRHSQDFTQTVVYCEPAGFDGYRRDKERCIYAAAECRANPAMQEYAAEWLAYQQALENTKLCAVSGNTFFDAPV